MKIAVLSSSTSSLLRFRMDMMKDFINGGHTVIALGPEAEADWSDKFKECHIDYRQLLVERNGINPLSDLKTYRMLYKFMKREKPDKVFAYNAKTVVYGSIAAKLNGITEIYLLIAGLGSILRGTGSKTTILKIIMKFEYWIACNCCKKVFFQNNDDKKDFINDGLVKNDQTVIINGSGVNLEMFQPKEFPAEPVFLFIGRLIRDKGIIEYLKACKEVKTKYPQVRCLLVGPYSSNPSVLTPEELQPYFDAEIIEYFGEQSDVRPYIAQCSIFILPSYHEGTPKAVLEAMAMGRPIITSDAPGCRETVTDGKNGYLVEVKNIRGLVEKMELLIGNPHLCQKLGEKSLEIAREKYDVRIVNRAIMRTMGLITNNGETI
jgi:glycosyltransferase involved in cell wall biosynthesis